MEVWNTAKPSAKKGPPRGTVKASAGLQYEDTARLYYEQLGFFFHSRNFRWHRLEADLLFLFPDKQRYLLVEVRGRSNRRFGVGDGLNPAKKKNLIRLAEALLRKLKRPLQLEYLEIEGEWDDQAHHQRKCGQVPTAFRIHRYRVC